MKSSRRRRLPRPDEPLGLLRAKVITAKRKLDRYESLARDDGTPPPTAMARALAPALAAVSAIPPSATLPPEACHVIAAALDEFRLETAAAEQRQTIEWFARSDLVRQAGADYLQRAKNGGNKSARARKAEAAMRDEALRKVALEILGAEPGVKRVALACALAERGYGRPESIRRKLPRLLGNVSWA